MEDYSKYVCVNGCDSENYEFLFVDFNYGEINSNGLNVYTEKGELTQSKKDVKKLLIEKIVELSNKNFESLEEDLKEGFTFNGDNLRKLYSTIFSGNSIISVRGYVGPSTNMIVSEKNYNKYDLKTVCESCNFNVLFDDNIKDIIIYRKNKIDQPGLVLSYFEDKYKLIETGYYPEKQYMKIVLKTNKNKNK